MSLVFRNDDVSGTTDIQRMFHCYDVIKNIFPESQILSAVSIFSKKNPIGSVYPGVPFKNNPQKWFYDVDSGFDLDFLSCMDLSKVVSHGMLHFDHSKASYDAQEMSILTSCNLLKTNIFVPPFNRFNLDTEIICKENNIFLIGKDEKWLSLETNKFNPEHKHWYFHSWRIGADKMKEILNARVTNHRE